MDRAAQWAWICDFNAKHPYMSLANVAAFAQDAGIITKAERVALVRA